ILRRGVVERGQRLPGNEQHVHRRLRVQVAEAEHIVVFVDDVGGNLVPENLAEDGLAHACSFDRSIQWRSIQSSSCRPPKACASVLRSTYSSSPPSGTPWANRVGRTPPARANWARKCAVASPSTVGLVAMINSSISPS